MQTRINRTTYVVIEGNMVFKRGIGADYGHQLFDTEEEALDYFDTFQSLDEADWASEAASHARFCHAG